MIDLERIVRSRHTPGVVILNGLGAVLYANPRAAEVVPFLCPFPAEGWAEGCVTPPEAIRSLCCQIGAAEHDAPAESICIICRQGVTYALRLFPVPHIDPPREAVLLLLIEPVTERRRVDFEAVKDDYHLSKREVEVLRLMCQGMSNREIAHKLFISEYTAKDHVKQIMQAFRAASRSEVIATLSQ